MARQAVADPAAETESPPATGSPPIAEGPPSRTGGVHKEFIVALKGKDYPTWPGILDLATRMGLRSLVTRVVQIPSPENGLLAVVVARAEFEDGRAFEDLGDCSPASTSPQLAAASLRLASTRAKGRVLRDATNVGMTMFEELPDLDNAGALEEWDQSQRSGSGGAIPARPGENGSRKCDCSDPDCGKPLTQGQFDISQRNYGQPLCPGCQKKYPRLNR